MAPNKYLGYRRIFVVNLKTKKDEPETYIRFQFN